jgi:hypothetical protein
VCSLVVNQSEKEPVVLVGPPGELSGRIQLHNPGDASLVVRDAGLKDPSGALRLSKARHGLRPLVLRPDQVGSLTLTIAVDPATPSGRYPAELELEGRLLPVILEVSELFELSVQPETLVVINLPDVRQRKQILVTNTGNVAFSLGEPGAVELHEDRRDDSVLRVALEPLLRGPKADLDAVVVALLAVAREEREPLGALEVRAPGGPINVPVGETATFELEITLRDKLPTHRRYRGRLPVLTQDVRVLVVPSGAAERVRRRGRSQGTKSNDPESTEGVTP